jgi:hypothetical protein
VERVQAALAGSELLRAVACLRSDGGRAFALGVSPLRRLLPEEVARLEAHGNFSRDWSRVWVAEGFDDRAIRNSSFHGDVILGRFTEMVPVTGGVVLPAGVSGSTVVDCVIGHNALVHDVRLLGNYIVGEGGILLNCGSVLCDGETTFGNGMTLTLGPETGGREVPVYAEVDVTTAATMARSRHLSDLLDQYGRAVADYARRARSARGIVARGAVARNTAEIRNTYLGPGARVENATLVADSTLLAEADAMARVASGACVRHALLQWGSRVADMAVLERVVLAEQAHVERHAKVSHSIIGCNSGIAAGEVTSSLLGPFVNCHHQALLIAVLWPEGKGNLSHGANVGSNHTSKAPDQEFIPGEGLFLGLGVNIKYPADYSRAPYTIIACGVNALPQRLAFPFSLVNLPTGHHPGIPPAYNQIVPAWVLVDNLYAIRRNEIKYQARDKTRHTQVECAVFRPAIIDLMRDALSRLENVKQRRDIYTEGEVDGLGKNYLLEEHRVSAIAAYRFFLRHYALLGLQGRLQYLLTAGRLGAPDEVLIMPVEVYPWEYQRQLLGDELGPIGAADALRLLTPMLEHVARAIEQSKTKDDQRGRAIIADYAAAHPTAQRDPVVVRTWQETSRLQQEIADLLCALEASPRAFLSHDSGVGPVLTPLPH